MILIDNYDSFTYNIVQYLRELGVNPAVYENDKISIEELRELDFESIIISPGAGNPDSAEQENTRGLSRASVYCKIFRCGDCPRTTTIPR